MSRGDSRLRAVTENSSATPVSRITVALIDRAAADLQATHERTQLSKTDIVNRAISLYEYIDAELSAGADLVIRRDGNDSIIMLL
jgi:hypothetical protein